MSSTIQEVLETVEKPLQQASVRNVYGEPINAQGKTIIPVAKIAYGFGGGSGKHHHLDGKDKGDDNGAGGGGGMAALPWGYVEITSEQTRFVRFTEWKRTTAALVLGLLFGALVAGRRAGRRESVRGRVREVGNRKS